MKPEEYTVEGVVTNKGGTFFVADQQAIAEMYHIIRFMGDCIVKLSIIITNTSGQKLEFSEEGSMTLEKTHFLINGNDILVFLYQSLQSMIGQRISIQMIAQNLGLDNTKWKTIQLKNKEDKIL